jgi:hypothetical protein
VAVSAVAVAGVVAATFAGRVTVGTGLAAILLAVLFNMVAFADFAVAIRTGAFGFGNGAHGANT